jgi:hypothetical protein
MIWGSNRARYEHDQADCVSPQNDCVFDAAQRRRKVLARQHSGEWPLQRKRTAAASILTLLTIVLPRSLLGTSCEHRRMVLSATDVDSESAPPGSAAQWLLPQYSPRVSSVKAVADWALTGSWAPSGCACTGTFSAILPVADVSTLRCRGFEAPVRAVVRRRVVYRCIQHSTCCRHQC